MKISNIISPQNLIPHLIAVLVFFLVSLIFFAPSIIGNKQLSQHDIVQSKGVSHQSEAYEDETGEESLWLNSTFSGMPAYLNGVAYPNPIVTTAHFIIRLGLTGPAGVMVISGISFYILLLTFRVNPWIAIIGGTAFALNGFTIISYMAGHNLKALAVSLMPLVLAGIHLTFSRHKWSGFFLTTIALALELYANHLQITYYLVMIVAAYGIYQLYSAIKKDTINDFLIKGGVLIGAAVLALGLNFGKIYTLYEYSKYSTRGPAELTSTDEGNGLDRDYVFHYSNGIFEPIVLFIPNFFGGSSTEELSKNSEVAKNLEQAGYRGAQLSNQLKSIPTYWGDQPLSAPYFAGVIPILLFALSYFTLPKRQTIWISVLVVLGIVLSWGKNFEAVNYFLYDYLPLYSKFRSVTFTIIISIFGIYLLGFRGLQAWMESDKKKETLLKAIGVCGGLALIFLVFGGMFSFRGSVDENLPDWFVTALRADRQSMLQKGAFKALVFILLSGGLMWMYIQKKVSNLVMVSGLMVLISIDMVLEGKRFIKSESFKRNAIEEALKATPADEYITSVAQPGERVLNLQNPFNDARTSYFHESIGGYHGAKMRRYQDFISHCLSAELNDIITSLQAGKRSFNTPALNMLNAKYLVAGSTKNAVLTNDQAFGNAWFATGITYVKSPNEEMASTCNLSGRAAIIDESKFDAKPSIGSGNIQLTEKTPNRVIYQANATRGGLALFSEIYYPKGWTVSIDGVKTDLLRANYILRAVEIPEGTHTVEFNFTPDSYKTGQLVTTSSSVLLGLLFLGFVVGIIRKKDE